MSVNEISIPAYSKKQELFNALSHYLGVFLAIFVLVFSIVKFVNQEISLFYFIGLMIFTLSMGIVYTISGTYHYLDRDNERKKIFRIFDHCSIYLLVAGTYTPICFVLMQTNILGIIILIIEWVGALIGIFMKAFLFNNKIARAIAFSLYVIMGWLALYTGIFRFIDITAFMFILIGGITYTIGAILYTLGRKNTNYHCIFHIFVFVSTIIQTIGVMLLF